MTSKLEQEFYDTFGIEPEINYVCDKRPCKKGFLKTCADIGCSHLYDTREDYPDITAEKLLEMICILNKTACEVLASENIEDLKNEILETCIKVYNTPILTSDGDEYDNYAIYDKIQQLFKGA